MRELTQRFCLLCLSGAFLAGVPALAEPPGPAPKAAEAEATPRFDVWEYRVEGNTVLDPKVIEKTVYGYLGPGKTIDDVEKARAALEKVYHDAGYAAALVDIPEQDVNEGVVVLTVGRVGSTGSRSAVPATSPSAESGRKCRPWRRGNRSTCRPCRNS